MPASSHQSSMSDNIENNASIQESLVPENKNQSMITNASSAIDNSFSQVPLQQQVDRSCSGSTDIEILLDGSEELKKSTSQDKPSNELMSKDTKKNITASEQDMLQSETKSVVHKESVRLSKDGNSGFPDKSKLNNSVDKMDTSNQEEEYENRKNETEV